MTKDYQKLIVRLRQMPLHPLSRWLEKYTYLVDVKHTPGVKGSGEQWSSLATLQWV